MSKDSPLATKPAGRLLVEMEGVTVRLRDRHILPQTCWQVREGELWAVLGPNGSGKSSLVRALAGLAPTSSGTIRWHLGDGAAAVGYVAFELEEELLGREQVREEARSFAHELNDALTAGDLLGGYAAGPGKAGPAPGGPSDPFDLRTLLDRPVRALSTGELRRVMIARALSGRPRLLILDEPFDGLDCDARLRLRELLSRLARSDAPLVLVTHHPEELPPEVTHLLLLREGRLVAQGPRSEVLAAHRLEELYGADRKRVPFPASPPAPPSDPETESPPALVELREVTVRYGETTALDRVSWRMHRGERWGLLGPNGSGKSTVLELIHGDNLQAYANPVWLFGRRRGSGESLWGIRDRLGYMSPRRQSEYRRDLPVLEAVASGFFDSIGLYHRPSRTQMEAAGRWIDRLGLNELADRPLLQLSFGQRRLALIARAMVKGPELLILDEPCAGLDPENRRLVLDLIDRIAAQTTVSLLYVSHRENELPRCLTHRLRLQAGRVVECGPLDRVRP